MKTTIKKLKNCKRVFEVKIPPERVRGEFDRVYDGIRKVATVPGYRVGKAPRELLELHYGDTARNEVIKNLIPESYKKVLEEHKLTPIAYPDISDVKMDLDMGLSYVATIEVRPEFSLKNYKGLRLKKKTFEVKEEDVNKNLEVLREINAEMVPAKEGGEKQKVLPELDDEFAKDLGFENLDRLKESVRNSLKNAKEEESIRDLELQVINQLVDMADFEVPESLVLSEKERLLKELEAQLEYINRMQKKENPDKPFTLTDKDRQELEKDTMLQAQRQIKAFFILDRIAQLENIFLEESDIEKAIEEMAIRYKKTKEEMRAYLEKNNLLDQMALNMRNARVMEFLLKEAKIE